MYTKYYLISLKSLSQKIFKSKNPVNNINLRHKNLKMKNALIQRELSRPRYDRPTEVTEYADFAMRIRKLNLDHVVKKNKYNLRPNSRRTWEKDIFFSKHPNHFFTLRHAKNKFA